MQCPHCGKEIKFEYKPPKKRTRDAGLRIGEVKDWPVKALHLSRRGEHLLYQRGDQDNRATRRFVGQRPSRAP